MLNLPIDHLVRNIKLHSDLKILSFSLVIFYTHSQFKGMETRTLASRKIRVVLPITFQENFRGNRVAAEEYHASTARKALAKAKSIHLGI